MGKEQFFKQVRAAAKKHAPKILTGLAIVGVGALVYESGRASIKAYKIVEEEKESIALENNLTDKEDIDAIKLTPKHLLELTWQEYVPTVVLFSSTISAIIGAHTTHSRRTTAIGAAYTLSTNTLDAFKRKTQEVVGDKKYDEIRAQVSAEKLYSKGSVAWDEIDEYGDYPNVFNTGNGSVLCVEEMNGTVFWSSIESIRKAENDFNFRLRQENYLYLNDFFENLGLPGTTAGDLLGWDVDVPLVLEFTSQLNSKGIPMLVVEYKTFPRPRY